MEPLPSTATDFFSELMAGGALYGLVSTWLIDLVIQLWEKHAGCPISGTKRRWISIAVALLVPVAAYLVLSGLGTVTLSVDGVYTACLVGVAAIAGNKVGYAGRESLVKPSAPPPAAPVQPKPDLPGGGQTLVAGPKGKAPDLAWFPTPAPGADSAPLSGAPAAGQETPSLVELLAADYGIPLDKEPEDTI